MNQPSFIAKARPVAHLRCLAFSLFALSLACSKVSAQTNATLNYASTTGSLPDASASVVKVLGALALVTAIFLGGVWLFRNWQRFVVRKGRAPQLNLIEVKSLGQRHALYVVGYQQQRMLLASSPTGVTLVSHLPEADASEAREEEAPVMRASFAQAFQQVLNRKS